MGPWKSRDIISALKKKGFSYYSDKDHHEYYYLIIDGKKQDIKTYFSHNLIEYNSYLMGMIKKPLKFDDSKNFEKFLECPFTKENYIDMLKEKGFIKN
ncbi:MAG: type II toxin-antitoxin system HicA family toxin [Ignavibacteriae bacterium]|nr:type II toxin-antitoxin system HicA family toxin [Ignavibacteriota bacterium]